MWEPRRLTTLWASTGCYRDNFTFIEGFMVMLGRAPIGLLVFTLYLIWVGLKELLSDKQHSVHVCVHSELYQRALSFLYIC
jgi:hypothetical protein